MRDSRFVLGYHGCDRELAEKIVLGRQEVAISENEYDWLGKGAYFWENDPRRALEWAQWIARHPQHAKHKIVQPTVVGAILDKGNCLDLTDSESLRLVKETYEVFRMVREYTAGEGLPNNKPGFSGDEDLVKRYLDCAMINFLHELKDHSVDKNAIPFDSVRGIFVEGGELYPGAKIMSRTHIQICIRRPEASVVAYFLPRPFETALDRIL